MKNIISFFRAKKNQSPISVVTCYDASFAALIQKTDIECILVGDSLGMVVQGHTNTISVSLDEMIYHTKAVRRGAPEKFIVIDLPFLSYQISLEEGIRSAGQAMRESFADAVKLEGGDEAIEHPNNRNWCWKIYGWTSIGTLRLTRVK
jgi:3-methyl-2-oxobutanoate hydroxymethyltransferase